MITDRVDVGVLVREAAQPGSGCHYVSLVPTQLRRLLDAGAPLSGFRGILLGGAAVPPGLLDEAAAAGANVITTYGMTETCGGCVYDGVPLDGVQVDRGRGQSDQDQRTGAVLPVPAGSRTDQGRLAGRLVRHL